MNRRTILVVDDEPEITDVVRKYLERDGYHVVSAADGRAALAAFNREKPNLVILDLMLPEVDGWEVAR
ncbi:MAG: response regulator, partial [bacterium]|nr:response regulator [bacterium]